MTKRYYTIVGIATYIGNHPAGKDHTLHTKNDDLAWAAYYAAYVGETDLVERIERGALKPSRNQFERREYYRVFSIKKLLAWYEKNRINF